MTSVPWSGADRSELFLTSESALEFSTVDSASAPRWMQIEHTGILRPALILLAGEAATFTEDRKSVV